VETTVTLTPSLARQWLGVNHQLVGPEVDAYTQAILAGEWRDGSTIELFRQPASDGCWIADGRHRAHAVERSGVSITVVVTVDAD
jgi:hypothetical protein